MKVRQRIVRPQVCAIAALVAAALMIVPTRAQEDASAAAEYWPDAVRILEQSTFGPTPGEIQHVQDVGSDQYWIEQLNAPMAAYPDLPPMPSTRPTDCTGTCSRDNYSMYPLQVHFFNNARTGHDQLRQRVAFALQQIFVVSAVSSKVTLPSWMGPYQQLLYADALGNFRQLLGDVTRNAAMGSYLNVLNNKKFNATTGIKPNENYARELLQLFSIGLVMLNPDGSTQLGGDGKSIPTYDQTTVEEFARVYTGWVLAPAFATGVPNYHDPMVPRDTDHDRGTKHLLNGFVINSGGTTQRDLDAALDNVFNHPNVGPFIAKQLIQHLVTSNPSPAYVARVAAVFNANEHGERGNLASVVHQILYDDESRGDVHDEPSYGHLLEPVLFVTRLLRAFNAASDGVLASYTASMGQDVFKAPSVFSFYPPGYRIVGGNGLLGPEFRLFDPASAFARINFVNTLVFNGIQPSLPDRPQGTSLDLTAYVPLASNPDALIASLNGLLLHRTMSAQMHDAIATAVRAVAATNPLQRVKTAVYLVASSSQYQVTR